MKIAITGNLCSGKTYLSNILTKKYNLELFSFSTKIKTIASELFNIKHKDRLLLQSISDNMKLIDEDIWIKYILSEIGINQNVIIDDLRFENEVKYLKEHGFIIIRINIDEDIRIERIKSTYPNTYNEHIKGMEHNSEKSIKNLEVDLDVYFTDDYCLSVLTTIDKFLIQSVICK